MVTREQLFVLNVIWGFVSILIGLAGLYFVFRYAVTVLATDDATRRMLLGDWVANIVGNTTMAVLIGVSLYMGFRVVLLIVSAATWENWVVTEHKAINEQKRLWK